MCSISNSNCELSYFRFSSVCILCIFHGYVRFASVFPFYLVNMFQKNMYLYMCCHVILLCIRRHYLFATVCQTLGSISV